MHTDIPSKSSLEDWAYHSLIPFTHLLRGRTIKTRRCFLRVNTIALSPTHDGAYSIFDRGGSAQIQKRCLCKPRRYNTHCVAIARYQPSPMTSGTTKRSLSNHSQGQCAVSGSPGHASRIWPPLSVGRNNNSYPECTEAAIDTALAERPGVLLPDSITDNSYGPL